MTSHPFRDVAVAGVWNTPQARVLPEDDSLSVATAGAVGALDDAGLSIGDVDGVVGEFAADMVLGAGLGPCSRRVSRFGIPMLLDAAALVATGECEVVVVAAGGAGVYTQRDSAAPWTRPANELVVGYGLFTAAEFALMARRHMLTYGTSRDDLSVVAAAIRNHGHANPAAVYAGRGPFTPDDIAASPVVAEPFHLLDCATTSEGGCGIVLTSAARALDGPRPPAWILGAAGDTFGPAYRVAPVWDARGSADDVPAGYVGRRAARICFRMAGLRPSDVDVAELYDPFSFEIIRQFEAFELCGDGEGAAFAASGAVPYTTDGGTMSFSHPGANAQMLQRVIRGVEQLRGTCATGQVPGAEVALCSNGGSGALFTDVLLLGSARP